MIEGIGLIASAVGNIVGSGFNFFATKDTNKANVSISKDNVEIAKYNTQAIVAQADASKAASSAAVQIENIDTVQQKQMILGVFVIILLLGAFYMLTQKD